MSAILTGAVGVVNWVSGVIPALHNRLLLIEDTLPLEVRHGSRLGTVLAGFALFLLAGSLWRRKRTAWLLTAVLLAISVVTHLLKGLDYEEASFSLGALVFLLLMRPSFHADSDPPSLRQGLVVLAAALVFTLLYGTAGFYLLARHFSAHFGLLAAAQQTLIMFASFNNPGLEPVTGFGRYFAASIYVIGTVTIGYALIMLIRPVLVREPATAAERGQAAIRVERYGRTALARPALFNDKAYFFSQGGSVIAYAVRGRGAMALGDPIGPPEDAAAAITSFRDFCVNNDWLLAFASVLPDYLESYHAAGLDTVCIGYEAILELNKFCLEGSENKNTRNAVNKLSRLGYRAEIHMPPLEDKLMHALRNISNAWLTMQHGGEMHFADGWFDEDYIRNSPVVVVYTPDGNPIAFANLVTEYQENEVTVDLMRRYQDAESGTMEFMFAAIFEWAKGRGFETFSLGMCTIVGVGEKPGDPRVEQALHTIAQYLGRFYNFKGLRAFKEKFHPRWEPRFLAYPGVSSLPSVLVTLLRVHSGNNFLWKYLKQ